MYHLNVCIIFQRDQYKPVQSFIKRVVHTQRSYLALLLHAALSRYQSAGEKSTVMNAKHDFSQEDCFIGPYPDEHWLLHLFYAFLTPPWERLGASTTPGHHEWKTHVLYLMLVFSINHIQYGPVNLIVGQLPPLLLLSRILAAGWWRSVLNGSEGLCRAAALGPFPAWQRLPVLTVKSLCVSLLLA